MYFQDYFRSYWDFVVVKHGQEDMCIYRRGVSTMCALGMILSICCSEDKCNVPSFNIARSCNGP